jgi:hypothetical protein
MPSLTRMYSGFMPRYPHPNPSRPVNCIPRLPRESSELPNKFSGASLRSITINNNNLPTRETWGPGMALHFGTLLCYIHLLDIIIRHHAYCRHTTGLSD